MEDRIIVVTGAAGGFGRRITERFHQENTVVAFVRKEQDRQTLFNHGAADVYQMDITDADSRKQAVRAVEDKYGRIDVLINNAGICRGGVQEALSDFDWQNQLETNVTGTAALTKLALPLLKAGSEAKIIQMGSVSGRIGLPGVGAYAASKFALRGLSQSLRFELLPLSIHVVLLEIASFKTDIWTKSSESASYYEGTDYRKLERFLKQHVDHTGRKAPDPEAVIRKIEAVCKNRNPAFLYRVGRGAGLYGMLDKWVPMKILEKIVAGKTGKNSK